MACLSTCFQSCVLDRYDDESNSLDGEKENVGVLYSRGFTVAIEPVSGWYFLVRKFQPDTVAIEPVPLRPAMAIVAGF